VLEGGLTFEKISLTPEDIELLSTRRFTVEEVCRFYGVPSVLINDTSGSTVWGSGIEQLVESFYRFGLRPYFERIEESARLNLLDRVDWDTFEFEFKIKDLLRASIASRIANNKVRIESGQSTINEVRIEEGYAPVDGGDNLMVAAQLLTLDRVIEGQRGEQKNEP
jgi:HK97 family phage portal protein